MTDAAIPAAAPHVAPSVLVERRGRLGVLTLNRPRSINALDHEMVGVLHRALDDWATDPDVETVLLRGAGDRGLCAGGDIVSLYHAATSGDPSSAARFWADEYRLNAAIAAYPKPYVALMDGIVLGGGVGVSAHASVRVVTERTRLGMPETGIGFVPDVGGTWLLSRAPGQTGTHAALTGALMTGSDAIALGLADHFVPSASLGALAAALETTAAEAAIAEFAATPPSSALLAARDWIDAAYAGDDVIAIARRLSSGGESAREAAAILDSKSPTAVTVTLRALREAAGLAELWDALRHEYRISVNSLAHPDFAEGVRAQVIDKDRTPAWRPPALAEVDAAAVDAYFAPVAPELHP